ncbi:MAG: GspMb/PilO family protein [Deltaproteobacteria bacterium]
MSKRKRLIRAAEKIALAIFILDVFAYGILVLGLGTRIQTASRLREDLLRKRQQLGREVTQLRQFQASLPEARKTLEQFEKDRVPTRRQGFSRAARAVREIAHESGVDVIGVSYKLGGEHKEPLERLGIAITAEGLYPSLVHFARSLETADDFIVVRDFSFQQTSGGALALRMSADLYLSR